jgi:hypothetical protein
MANISSLEDSTFKEVKTSLEKLTKRYKEMHMGVEYLSVGTLEASMDRGITLLEGLVASCKGFQANLKEMETDLHRQKAQHSREVGRKMKEVDNARQNLQELIDKESQKHNKKWELAYESKLEAKEKELEEKWNAKEASCEDRWKDRLQELEGSWATKCDLWQKELDEKASRLSKRLSEEEETSKNLRKQPADEVRITGFLRTSCWTRSMKLID